MKNSPSVFGSGGRRLRVKDPAHVVRMEGRDARLGAHLDAAVVDEPSRSWTAARPGILDVDPDSRRNQDRLAVDEDIQVRVHVIGQELLRLGFQPGLDRPLHRIVKELPS